VRGLQGKIVAITGGAGDIGQATARRLSEEGARVHLLDVIDAVEGEQVSKECGAQPYWRCSQTDRSAVDQTFAAIASREGRLDCVILNAARTSGAGVADMDMAEWRAIVELNLHGPVECSQSALRIMLSQPIDNGGVRGKILFTGSQCQRRPEHGGVAYQVTKRALERFCEQLAYDYAADRVLSNMLLPGILNAGLTRRILEAKPELTQVLLDRIPIGEFGTPEQCGNAFAFLCSEESNYMTGASLVVDGGCVIGRAERSRA
jgi:NAD(P)-dependent dehydrogenase (short-subunit alcohol dehydrogenase family)